MKKTLNIIENATKEKKKNQCGAAATVDGREYSNEFMRSLTQIMFKWQCVDALLDKDARYSKNG